MDVDINIKKALFTDKSYKGESQAYWNGKDGEGFLFFLSPIFCLLGQKRLLLSLWDLMSNIELSLIIM